MLQKILIVDDQPDMLDIMKALLENEGYVVTTLVYVDDVKQAISLYHPDVVILDYLLAGVNGGELCREIKADAHTAAIPVILLSAYPRLQEAFGTYGSDAFVAKPFDLQHLTDTVKNCLQKNGGIKHEPAA
jgi:DNA-binding response OmpR family regulator